MNLKNIILILSFLSSLNASILYDARSECIEDYYVSNSRFYYLRSSNNQWYSTTTDNQVKTLFPNYIYDNGKCLPNLALYFGLEQTQFNFLLALSGLLIGLIILVTSVYLVLNVGGRK